MKTKRRVVPFLASIFVCQLAGGIGAIFTTPAIPTWYATLTKPSFSPPNWLFAPVWTALYLFMGIALFLIWEKEGKERKTALFLFVVQLFLNSLWSIIFFGLKSPSLALGEIILLWVMIFLTIKKFFSLDKAAGWLLLPYLFWVSFASILNLAIVLLN